MDIRPFSPLSSGAAFRKEKKRWFFFFFFFFPLTAAC